MQKTVLTLGLAASLAACGGPSPPTYQYIRIGAVIDQTGSNAVTSFVDAVRLAEEHANQALRDISYKNLQFNIIVQDSQNIPDVATARSIDLVQVQGAKALIVDTSQNTIAVNRLNYDADLTNDLNVPIQCSGCTSGSINNPTAADPDPITQATLQNGERWLFKGGMSTGRIAMIIDRVLLGRGALMNGDVDGDGMFKMGIYASDESFGRSTAASLVSSARTALMPAGLPFTVEETYFPAAADPTLYGWPADLVTLLDATGGYDGYDTVNMPPGPAVMNGAPDALVVVAFAQFNASIVRAYQAGLYTTPLMFTHTMRLQSVLDSLGSAAEGLEGVSHVLIDNGAPGDGFSPGDDFRTLYEQRYGVPINYRDAMWYDNPVTLMLATILASKDLADPTTVTPLQIHDAMLQINDPAGTVVGVGPAEFARAVGLIVAGTPINYEGASGPMDYDADQNVKNRLAHYQVQGGQYVDLETYDCVASAATCPLIP